MGRGGHAESSEGAFLGVFFSVSHFRESVSEGCGGAIRDISRDWVDGMSSG